MENVESAKGDIDAFEEAEQELMTIEGNLSTAESVIIFWSFQLL